MSEDTAVRNYRLGRLTFSVSGRCPILGPLAGELSSLSISEPSTSEGVPARRSEKSSLHFEFVEHIPDLAGAVLAAPVAASPDSFRVDLGSFQYLVESKGSCLHVQVKSRPASWKRRIAPQALLRARDWNYLSWEEQAAKNFMYEIFDYMTQAVQMRLGQSYLHASTFEWEGKGIALLAWGGVGKTTAVLKFLQETGGRFLSDDLGLIDDSGTLWRTPKHMQIYAYNVAGQPLLDQMLLAGRPPLDRLSWYCKRFSRGEKGVRRRVSAEQFFGNERVAVRAPLSRAFMMERVNQSGFDCVPLEVGEFAKRAAATLLEELRPLGMISAAMCSGSHQPLLPGSQAVHETSYRIIEKAFSRVQPWLIRIPSRARPDELAEFLKRRLEQQP